jgi:Zn-finger nucleic acid-binding protein
MSERSGIEIDYCPTCRGVWLDRGEMDKIIERSLGQPAPQPPAPAPPAYGYQKSGHHGGYQQGGHYQKRRKESWLGQIFD